MMERIIEIQQGLIDWLREQAFDPAIRSIDLTNQPVAVYPQACLNLGEEAFWPGQADTTVKFNLELRVAAGRTRDARAAAASLAHQLRRALAGSHGIGGLAKQLSVERIAYESLDSETGSPVVEQATLALLVRYVDREL